MFGAGHLARLAATPQLSGRLTAAAPRRAQRRENGVRCFSNADNSSVEVSFSLPYHCKFGQRLCLIGGADNLGAWDVANAVPMQWTEGDVWIVDLQLPLNGNPSVEYKYVVRSEHDMEAVRWKDGGNFQLRLPSQGRLRVRDTWDESCREVEVDVPSTAAAVVAPPPAQHEAHAVPQADVPAIPQPVAQAEVSVRKPRKKKVDEDTELQATISKAADKAMQQLDAAVSRSMDLMTHTGDPAAEELLAADRLVAAAAKRATTMNRALDAAKEAKLLAGGGGKNGSSSSRASSSGQRRRRAAVANPEAGANGKAQG